MVSAKRNEGHFADLSDEMNKVASSLRKEQSYSAQLMQEVEGLKNAVLKQKDSNGAGRDPMEEEEKRMYQEQVSALMEGKALLSQEVLDLRQRLADSAMTAKEKEKLVEKAAQLSADNVNLKATLDETVSQKAGLEEKIKVMQETIEQRLVFSLGH